jgi:hypothetical protein
MYSNSFGSFDCPSMHFLIAVSVVWNWSTETSEDGGSAPNLRESSFLNSSQSTICQFLFPVLFAGYSLMSIMVSIGRWSALGGRCKGSTSQLITFPFAWLDMKILSGRVQLSELKCCSVFFGSIISISWSANSSRSGTILLSSFLVNMCLLRSSSQRGWWRLKSPAHMDVLV